MAVNNPSGLIINNQQTGIQYTKVTDSSADWVSVANSTYFYDLTDKLVHYKDSTGTILEIFSASSPALRNITATTTFATAEETINCTANTFTVNLPTAVGIQGTTYTLVNSGTGVITLNADGTETINGSLTIDLSSQYISRTVQSDGSNWIII